jgi:uncharacterized damage-inducible protein DinB
MTSTREFFKKRFEEEQPAFLRVLKALPADQLSYRSHERSATAGGIAWQLALEQKALATLSDAGDLAMDTDSPPPALDEIVASYESATEQLRGLLGRMDDARWSGQARFLMGGNPVWTTTVDDLFWGFLFDMVHHRGQLSTYIRPMGGKVPSIYGPSADTSGGE